ncbi:MAG: hypothetical protein ABI613_02630 [Gemmatimonadota bacterium]
MSSSGSRTRAVSSELTRLIRRLRDVYGAPSLPPASDPYHLLLLEQVSYLADDVTQLAAYRMLERDVGTRPDQILSASTAVLRKVTRAGGGIAFAERAERLREVAARVSDHWNGDLGKVLRLTLPQASRELMKFPKIGLPGAERILLLAGAYPVLALDSNALRVLLRLGYGKEFPSYPKTYGLVQQEAERDLARTIPARRTASLLLQRHGKTICRRATPRCLECPLQPACPYGGGTRRSL